MATALTFTSPDQNVRQAVWAALANGETGVAATMPAEFTRRSVQVSGTFGVGGSVTIEGSHDNVVWSGLSNSISATVFAIAAAGIQDILQDTPFVRARVTAGDGTTSLKVSVLASK